MGCTAPYFYCLFLPRLPSFTLEKGKLFSCFSKFISTKYLIISFSLTIIFKIDGMFVDEFTSTRYELSAYSTSRVIVGYSVMDVVTKIS